MKRAVVVLVVFSGCFGGWSYWDVTVDWVDPPPVIMSSTMDYPVTVAVSGGSNVSHCNIHWATAGDPRYDPEGTTASQAGTAGQFNFILNITSNTARTFYIAIHAEVDGLDYYSAVVPITVAPRPFVEWTSFPPEPMDAGTDYGVDFDVTGGGSVDSIRVQWAVSRDPSYSPTAWTTAQSGVPGPFTDTLNVSPGEDKTYLFVVKAVVDGDTIYSPIISRLVQVAPPADLYEANNDFASAYFLGGSGSTPSISAWLYPSGDRDFYYVITGGGLLTIDLSSLPADYDLYLYDTSFDLVDWSSQYGVVGESIALTVGSGTYYIEVRGFKEAWSESSYDLDLTVP